MSCVKTLLWFSSHNSSAPFVSFQNSWTLSGSLQPTIDCFHHVHVHFSFYALIFPNKKGVDVVRDIDGRLTNLDHVLVYAGSYSHASGFW